MGIDINSARLLRALGARGLIRGRLGMLGRQGLLFTQAELRRYLHHCGVANEIVLRAAEGVKEADFAEGFFGELGAEQVDAIDISDFEGANVVLDLNQPLEARRQGCYDVIFDGGTLEHIYNAAVAADNVRKLLRPGGTLISIGPGNNYCGHGFYQFSPEFYYRSFGRQAGFTQTALLAWETIVTGQKEIYAIADPETVGLRFEFKNARPTTFCCVARYGTGGATPAARQQSDYVTAWKEKATGTPPEKSAGPAGIRLYLIRHGWTWIKALTPFRWGNGCERIPQLEQYIGRVFG